MVYLIVMLSVILTVLLFTLVNYAIKYINGVKDQAVKSPIVAMYYDRICLLGMAVVFLIVLIGVLLGGN